MKKIQFIIIPIILSFGLIISSALISNAMNRVSKDENRITVKGVAERRIKADKALINIVISKSSNNLEELKKEISEREKRKRPLLTGSRNDTANHHPKMLPLFFAEEAFFIEMQFTGYAPEARESR